MNRRAAKRLVTTRERATLARSIRLLGEFRFEQTDPARFYGALAADTVALVEGLWRDLNGTAPQGRTVLDVGGGPGYFATEFSGAGMTYIGVEPDEAEAHAGAAMAATSNTSPAAQPDGAGTFVRASGMALPFADGSVDVCLSSNVAEHVRDPWLMGREMLRVTRPGGLVILSYTVWLGPFGGHEMGLTHYLGGRRAATGRRTTTDRHCSRCLPRLGSSGRAVLGRWSRHSRATTRDGRGTWHLYRCYRSS